MNNTLRTLILAASVATGQASMAQQPYSVTIGGQVVGCTANSFVHIVSAPGTQPAIDIDVPVLPPSCSFAITLSMATAQGGFTVSAPCNGAIQSQEAWYMTPAMGDSTSVYLVLNCSGTPTDCMGVIGGSALPGTACTTFFGLSGLWSADCQCLVDTSLVDCEGVPDGPAMPGSPCVDPGNGMAGIWTTQCWCDTTATMDCLGVPGGTNLPGSPCWTPGTTFIGTWDASCTCIGGGGLPCQAGLWVLQAYGPDSLPVPNEVWVWNLSTGSGAMTYLWSFGDGTSSTDAFPTHTYSGNGPYALCLTITDASGCSSTACDTISIDENGIFTGMVINGETSADGARDSGFTLNVQDPLTTSVTEMPALSNVALWPNPATDELNMALVALADGSLNVTFFDVNGRQMRQENRAISAGRNQQRFDIGELPAGLYTARATDRSGNSISLRFAKTK